jgi:hypothetical protein
VAVGRERAVGGGSVHGDRGPDRQKEGDHGLGHDAGFPVDAGVYAFDVRGCGKPICQPRAFVQLSTSQAYQGSSIAVSGGKVLLNSTDNTPFPAPSQTNLYVLAPPES